MNQQVAALGEIEPGFIHRRHHRFEHVLADQEALLQRIPGVEDLEADLVQIASSVMIGDATARAVKPSDRATAS